MQLEFYFQQAIGPNLGSLGLCITVHTHTSNKKNTANTAQAFPSPSCTFFKHSLLKKGGSSFITIKLKLASL